MNWNNLILMRQEILLTTIILLLLAGEIFTTNKKKTIQWCIFLFGLHTIAGFFPIKEEALFGGMFRTNNTINFFKTVLNLGVLVILLQSADWVQEKITPLNKSIEFYLLILSSLLGMYFMISSGDFLMFYVGLELSTLPIAALVSYETSKRISGEAGIKFILSAAFASGISLLGISFLYATTGSIYFETISQNITLTNLTTLGFILFLSGLMFKIALVPFHFWAADVYQGAPIGVAAYLSVISKSAAVFILMILLFTVLKPLIFVWEKIFYILAISSMFVGNLFAIRQQNIKRFLAFSSVAQAGFILLGLLSETSMGATSTTYFITIYIFSNLAAFGVVQAISTKTGKENIHDYNGLYKTNPNLSLVMLLALFSLAGIPPTAGFFAKFFLFMTAASKGYYILVFFAVANATISLYYYLLVIRAMFITKNDNPIVFFKSKINMRLGLLISVIAIITFGLYGPLYDYIYKLNQFFN